MQITHASIYVSSQQNALAWYIDKLGFRKHTDAMMSETAHWITICLPEQPEFQVVLEDETTAQNAEMAADIRSRVGKSGTIVLEVSDVRQLVSDLKARGVAVMMEPFDFQWGTQSVIADPDGNKWVLSQAPEGGYPAN